jgi:hypothetical protein
VADELGSVSDKSERKSLGVEEPRMVMDVRA